MKEIYVDGACSGNPGPGGWAVIVINKNRIIKQWGGAEFETTNNRMELTAAIEALHSLKNKEPAIVFTDSTYVKNGITVWLQNWKKKNWISTNKKAVKNQDLWQELDRLNQKNIHWQYIPGHSGIKMNEQCDKLARKYIKLLLKKTQ